MKAFIPHKLCSSFIYTMIISHMVDVLCTATMLMLINKLPILLIALFSWSVPIVSLEKINFPEQCARLGSYIDCSNKQLMRAPNELPSWTDKLKLHKNMLTDIPHFITDSNLTELSLGHNRIKSISRRALEKMNNLETLELNNNNIKEINSNDFPSLPKLKTLNLNHNEIAKIENGSFSGLINLTDLKINRNKLTNLNPNTFKPLNKLINLELNRNMLTEITGLTFKGLEMLKTLELRQNLIEDLADGAFYGLFSLRELHLNNNKLATTSKGWLYGLELLSRLNVSSNKIHSLNSGWDFCAHLLELDISNNKLESIQRETFEHLSNLIELKLDNNRISYIEDDAFQYLPSLQRLDLSNNLISWIVENRNGAFAPLRRLNHLWLAGNKIAHISREAFAGLSNVSHLDLSGNAVASIEENPFRNMPELTELTINSSSLICDCSLSWMVQWLNQTSVQKNGNLSCVYPIKLQKRSLYQMSMEELVCTVHDHPQPQIITHPEDAVAIVGNNVTLRCGANSSVEVDMTFTWKLNNSRLENAIIKQSVQNQGVAQFSDLILTAVTMANTGSYQCVVSNNYGIAYSKLSQLSVFVFPRFKKTPSNVVVNVGKAAKLECCAEGFPAPKISWQKDGGTKFPAAISQRMQVMNIDPDEPFFIVNVRLEDAGVYTCTAKNEAGTVSWNATLNVLEAPSFSKQMRNKEVHYGEATVLECLGVGSPKPKITWIKNNKSITLTKRHFLTAEDQLLIITDASLDDTGLYECELSNGLGNIRSKAELKVIPISRFFDASYSQATMLQSGFTFWDVVAIVITTLVSTAVITSAVWVAFIHKTRKNRRLMRTPLSPVDMKSENSSHSSKDSGTGDSTKRSYQDLLLTASNPNHASIMGSHSESPSPVPESTLPLLTTFHPIPVDNAPYIKESNASVCAKTKHPTPIHYQAKPELEQHPTGLFCGSPASSNGIQCACLSATFKKTSDVVCDCITNNSPVTHQCMMNHCSGEHEIACYGDLGKRPCSIPVPFHAAAHSVTASCCRHHPNSYLCLYMPPAQHTVPQ